MLHLVIRTVRGMIITHDRYYWTLHYESLELGLELPQRREKPMIDVNNCDRIQIENSNFP